MGSDIARLARWNALREQAHRALDAARLDDPEPALMEALDCIKEMAELRWTNASICTA